MRNRKDTDLKNTELEDKNRRIEVRISDRELQLIDKSANQLRLTRSEYLRMRGLKGVYTRKQELPDTNYAKLMLNYRELKAQGNNLNQIAKVLNQSRLEGKEVDLLTEIELAIVANRQTVEAIRQALP
jgi:hypothetical protein